MAVKNNTNFPKISIIIPSYNKVDYISRTLQSIIDQNYSNLEVIIQDAGSSDGSVNIIKQYARKYPKVLKWVSGKDGGQVDAINEGLRKSTGEILTFINADDILSKESLKAVGNIFLNNPQTLWITGYGDIINDQDRVNSSFVTKYKNMLLNLNNYQILLMVNYLTQPATFITRKAYEEFGPFTGTKNYVMEYDYWLKLGKKQMPVIIKKNLASFRLTMDNISATSFNELLKLDLEIARKYTKNWLILYLHLIHNKGRIALLNILKNK